MFLTTTISLESKNYVCQFLLKAGMIFIFIEIKTKY